MFHAAASRICDGALAVNGPHQPEKLRRRGLRGLLAWVWCNVTPPRKTPLETIRQFRCKLSACFRGGKDFDGTIFVETPSHTHTHTHTHVTHISSTSCSIGTYIASGGYRGRRGRPPPPLQTGAVATNTAYRARSLSDRLPPLFNQPWPRRWRGAGEGTCPQLLEWGGTQYKMSPPSFE